jgi:hypothetical protein
VAFEYVTTGGGDGGGHSDFISVRPPGCNLVVGDSGLITQLDFLRVKWETKYRVGLFQNDAHPSLTWTLANVVPADFSGYAGLQLSFGWTPSVVNNTRAVTQANALTWMHDGGPVSNFIYGYYVVDDHGAYMWAERFCPAPQIVLKIGTRVRVIPTFTMRNDIPQ